MKSRLFLGIIFIVCGMAAVCNQLGIVNVSNISSVCWPLILIVIGAERLYMIKRFNIGAAIMVLFGILFELQALHICSQNVYDFVAPSVIIIVGIFMISQREKAIR